MQRNDLQGHHHCVEEPVLFEPAVIDGHADTQGSGFQSMTTAIVNGHTNGNDEQIINGYKMSTPFPRLLVWSAADAPAINRMIKAYEQ